MDPIQQRRIRVRACYSVQGHDPDREELQKSPQGHRKAVSRLFSRTVPQRWIIRHRKRNYEQRPKDRKDYENGTVNERCLVPYLSKAVPTERPNPINHSSSITPSRVLSQPQTFKLSINPLCPLLEHFSLKKGKFRDSLRWQCPRLSGQAGSKRYCSI